MDLATAMAWAAERHPDRRAVGGERPMTYRQWEAHTNQLARLLAGLGVGRGDRVALSLAGGEPLASLHLAAQKLGAVSVPLSTRLSTDELAYCLDDAEPTLLVTDESTAASAERAGLSTPQRDVADLVPADQRGTAYGLFNAAIGIAALPASVIAGVLWQGIGSWHGFGPSAPFYLGAIMAVLAFVMLAFLPEPKPRSR